MSDDTTFTLKDGEATYDSFFDAVTVAEAKASEENRAVTVCRRLLNTFEDLVRVHPDGRRETLADDFEPDT